MLWRILFTLLAGALLPIAFAPFNIYSLAFFAPALLLYYWLKSTPKQALLLGFIFGCGFFGTGISWVYISIHYFGNASTLLATFLTACVIVLMSLHIAIFGYLFRKLFQKKSLSVQCLLVFPALWVLFELLNTAILGFPWLLLGYSQITNPLKGLAPIIGVHGLSLCVAMISGALVLLITEKRFKTHILSFGVIILIVGSGLIFKDHTWTRPSGKPFKASLIQGNIPQAIKWNPDFVLQNINVYTKLTTKHLDSKLIVWPEGAVPVTAEDIPQFTQQLDTLAKQHNTTIIFGAPSENKKNKRFYNALFMLGNYQGKYLKRHLVHYGEYVPFAAIIRPIDKKLDLIVPQDLSHGPKNQPLLKFNGISIAPFICYEVAYPQLVLNSAENSQLLLTASDDSWFGKSLALTQQLQMSQMRALETGRYMLLATNTGITAFISPTGKILKGAAIDKREVITSDVTPMSGKTPLMRWHYYPIYILIGCFLLISFFALS